MVLTPNTPSDKIKLFVIANFPAIRGLRRAAKNARLRSTATAVGGGGRLPPIGVLLSSRRLAPLRREPMEGTASAAVTGARATRQRSGLGITEIEQPDLLCAPSGHATFFPRPSPVQSGEFRFRPSLVSCRPTCFAASNHVEIQPKTRERLKTRQW